MAKTKKRKAIRHARIKVGRNLEATWIGTNNMGPNTRSSLKLKLKLMTHEMRRTVRQIAICTDKRHMAGAAAIATPRRVISALPQRTTRQSNFWPMKSPCPDSYAQEPDLLS